MKNHHITTSPHHHITSSSHHLKPLTVLRSYALTLFFLLCLISCSKENTNNGGGGGGGGGTLKPPAWIQGIWSSASDNYSFTSNDVFKNGESLCEMYSTNGMGMKMSIKEKKNTDEIYELLAEITIGLGKQTTTTLYSFKKGDKTYIEAGTAQNGETIEYAKFNLVPGFTSFTFDGIQGTATIDATHRTVKAVAAKKTDLAAIKPNFKLTPNGSTAKVNGVTQTAGTSVQNFTNPVTYTLETTEGETAEWTVTITLKGGEEPEGKLAPPAWIQGKWEYGNTSNYYYKFTTTDVFQNEQSLSEMYNVDVPGIMKMTIKETKKTDEIYELLGETTALGETQTVVYSFKKGNGCNIVVDNEKFYNMSNGTIIAEFAFSGQHGTEVVDVKKRTVTAVAESTIGLKKLKPRFKIFPNETTAIVDGIEQTSGTSIQNFTNPVKYTLKTKEGETVEWTVTITHLDGKNR